MLVMLGKEGAGTGNGEKGMPQKLIQYQGVYDPLALKLDPFQPVKLILFQKIPPFLPSLQKHSKSDSFGKFKLNSLNFAPFLLRNPVLRREEGGSRGRKWEKGTLQK